MAERRKTQKKSTTRRTARREAPQAGPTMPMPTALPAGTPERPKTQFELRRDALLSEKRALQESVARERDRGGYGPKTERAQQAAERRGKEIEAELKELNKEEINSNPTVQGVKVASRIAFPVAGIAAGHYLAQGIEAAHTAALAAKSAQTTSLAKEIGSLLKTGASLKNPILQAKLAAYAEAAKGMKLSQLKGPSGLPRAAALAVEAGILYYVANEIEDPVTKELVKSAASGFGLAATGLLAERAIQNSAIKALPSAVDTGAVIAAEKLATVKGLKGLKDVSDAAKALPKVTDAGLTKHLTKAVAKTGEDAAKIAAKSAAAKSAAATRQGLKLAKKMADDMAYHAAKNAAAAQKTGALSQVFNAVANVASKVPGSAMFKSAGVKAIKALPVIGAGVTVLSMGAVAAEAASTYKGERAKGVPKSVAAGRSYVNALSDLAGVPRPKDGAGLSIAAGGRVVSIGYNSRAAETRARLHEVRRRLADQRVARMRSQIASQHSGTQSTIKDQPGTGMIPVRATSVHYDSGKSGIRRAHTRRRAT